MWENYAETTMTTMEVEIPHVPTMEAGTEFRAKFPTHSKWDVHPGCHEAAVEKPKDNGWTTGGDRVRGEQSG